MVLYIINLADLANLDPSTSTKSNNEIEWVVWAFFLFFPNINNSVYLFSPNDHAKIELVRQYLFKFNTSGYSVNDFAGDLNLLAKHLGYDLEAPIPEENLFLKSNDNNFFQMTNEYQKYLYLNNLYNPNYLLQCQKEWGMNYLYNQAGQYNNLQNLYKMMNSPNNYLSILNNINNLNGLGVNQSNINLLVNYSQNTKIYDNSRNNINIVNNILPKDGVTNKTFPNKSNNINNNIGNNKVTKKNETKQYDFFTEMKRALKENKTNPTEVTDDNSDKSKLLNKKRDRVAEIDDSLRTPPVEKKSKPRKVAEQPNLAPAYIKTLSYKDFEDNEMQLIESIDKPKKKKANKAPEVVPEKSQLKEDLEKYAEQFKLDLEHTLKDESHNFMKVNFPVAYELENYYLYIKQISEKRQNKKSLLTIAVEGKVKAADIINAIEQQPPQENTTTEIKSIKKIWNPNAISSVEGKINF
jgi:hypothetical protein